MLASDSIWFVSCKDFLSIEMLADDRGFGLFLARISCPLTWLLMSVGSGLFRARNFWPFYIGNLYNWSSVFKVYEYSVISWSLVLVHCPFYIRFYGNIWGGSGLFHEFIRYWWIWRHYLSEVIIQLPWSWILCKSLDGTHVAICFGKIQLLVFNASCGVDVSLS